MNHDIQLYLGAIHIFQPGVAPGLPGFIMRLPDSANHTSRQPKYGGYCCVPWVAGHYTPWCHVTSEGSVVHAHMTLSTTSLIYTAVGQLGSGCTPCVLSMCVLCVHVCVYVCVCVCSYTSIRIYMYYLSNS
jgi:hypothetical protein